MGVTCGLEKGEEGEHVHVQRSSYALASVSCANLWVKCLQGPSLSNNSIDMLFQRNVSHLLSAYLKEEWKEALDLGKNSSVLNMTQSINANESK